MDMPQIIFNYYHLQSQSTDGPLVPQTLLLTCDDLTSFPLEASSYLEFGLISPRSRDIV